MAREHYKELTEKAREHDRIIEEMTREHDKAMADALSPDLSALNERQLNLSKIRQSILDKCRK